MLASWSLDDPRAGERLIEFEGLLLRDAVPRGWVASGDADRLLERHILDGLRGVAAIPPDASGVIDVGSGAGIPGLSLAIGRPGTPFTLCEPRSARAAFLEVAVERLALENVSVETRRVQDVEPASFDVATARAFAPLQDAWLAISPVLVPGGRVIVWAGVTAAVPTSLPGTSSIKVERAPNDAVLASAGPLIIITRQ